MKKADTSQKSVPNKCEEQVLRYAKQIRTKRNLSYIGSLVAAVVLFSALSAGISYIFIKNGLIEQVKDNFSELSETVKFKKAEAETEEPKHWWETMQEEDESDRIIWREVKDPAKHHQPLP